MFRQLLKLSIGVINISELDFYNKSTEVRDKVIELNKEITTLLINKDKLLKYYNCILKNETNISKCNFDNLRAELGLGYLPNLDNYMPIFGEYLSCSDDEVCHYSAPEGSKTDILYDIVKISNEIESLFLKKIFIQREHIEFLESNLFNKFN